MYVADMYIKVTQYDTMQRAFVCDSPQLRVIGSFLLFGILIVCVFLHDDVLFSGKCISFKKNECMERFVVYMVRQ